MDAGRGWRGTGGALLVRQFPGLTGESGQEEQNGTAALLGLDVDVDVDAAAQLGRVLLRKRVHALLGPAGICGRCWSGESWKLGTRTRL